MGGEVVEENGGQIDGDGRGFDCGWSTCNAIDRVHVIDINQKDMKSIRDEVRNIHYPCSTIREKSLIIQIGCDVRKCISNEQAF